MNRCEDCKHSAVVDDNPNFVRCWLRLPSWVAAGSDDLSGNKMVLKNDHCSFFEHPNMNCNRTINQYSAP